MELGNWNRGPISKLKRRYLGLREFLGEVLEGEHSLIEPTEESGASDATTFQIRHDVRALENYRPLNYSKAKKVDLKHLFSQFAPFFEAGFFLTSKSAVAGTGQSMHLEAMFLFGRCFEGSSSTFSIQLPHVSPQQVWRGRIQPLLKSFHLQSLKALQEADAFVFSPKPGSYFVFVCNRPHPWQVGHIEETFSILTSIMERYDR